MKPMTAFRFIFLALLLAVCSSFYEFHSNSFTGRPSGDSTLLLVQKKFQVFDTDFIRTGLYTWTSKEQIETVRQKKQLLFKSSSEKYGKSKYDLLLEEQKVKGNMAAAFLSQERFASKRFGWPHPWATVRGYPGENYGDQLIKISFKEDAIFGSFITTATDTLSRFYSSKGKPLDTDFALLHPERLAVVYFVHSRTIITKEHVSHGTYGRKSRFRKTISRELPYREYVICNEGMIKEWSYGTQVIRDKLKEDIDYLQQLKKALAAKQKDAYPRNSSLSGAASEYWPNPQYAGEYAGYISTLALVNSYYDLDEKQLAKTINTLNKVLSAQADSLIINN